MIRVANFGYVIILRPIAFPQISIAISIKRLNVYGSPNLQLTSIIVTNNMHMCITRCHIVLDLPKRCHANRTLFINSLKQISRLLLTLLYIYIYIYENLDKFLIFTYDS